MLDSVLWDTFSSQHGMPSRDTLFYRRPSSLYCFNTLNEKRTDLEQRDRKDLSPPFVKPSANGSYFVRLHVQRKSGGLARQRDDLSSATRPTGIYTGRTSLLRGPVTPPTPSSSSFDQLKPNHSTSPSPSSILFAVTLEHTPHWNTFLKTNITGTTSRPQSRYHGASYG